MSIVSTGLLGRRSPALGRGHFLQSVPTILPASFLPTDSLMQAASHLESSCEFVWIYCPQGCTNENSNTVRVIRRGQLRAHLSECPGRSQGPSSIEAAARRLVIGACADCGYKLNEISEPDHDSLCHETRTVCPFNENGCEIIVEKREHMLAHLKAARHRHLRLLLQENVRLRAEYTKTLERIESHPVPSAVSALSNRINDISGELGEYDRAFHCRPITLLWTLTNKVCCFYSKLVV